MTATIAEHRTEAAVSQDTVLAICQTLHDRKCRQGASCFIRDSHALQGFGATVSDVLTLASAIRPTF